MPNQVFSNDRLKGNLETHVPVEHLADQILRYAEDNHADMIVTGWRGLTPATLWIRGSVSERVMRYAHCLPPPLCSVALR